MRRGQDPVAGDYAPAAADSNFDDEGPGFSLDIVAADDSLGQSFFDQWSVAFQFCWIYVCLMIIFDNC